MLQTSNRKSQEKTFNWRIHFLGNRYDECDFVQESFIKILFLNFERTRSESKFDVYEKDFLLVVYSFCFENR